MVGIIAEVAVDSKNKEVAGVRHFGELLRFKCQRCAIFCCKLGPPQLLPRDIERIEQAGLDPIDILNGDRRRLKIRSDGSCAFLSSSGITESHVCSIYDLRPTLCRLYPFHFERSGRDLYTIKPIPCCKGLNSKRGEIVDARFVAQIAESALLELIDAGLV